MEVTGILVDELVRTVEQTGPGDPARFLGLRLAIELALPDDRLITFCALHSAFLF